MMFNQCTPTEAVRRYIGEVYVQHNPQVADGKDAIIDCFERVAKKYPGKRVHFKRMVRGGNYVFDDTRDKLVSWNRTIAYRNPVTDHREIEQENDSISLFARSKSAVRALKRRSRLSFSSRIIRSAALRRVISSIITRCCRPNSVPEAIGTRVRMTTPTPPSGRT